MRRVGLLTSGGDCQALNAVMRGLAKALYSNYEDMEIIGFKDGYKGLIKGDYTVMAPECFSGLLMRGGTILGTSRQPFKLMRVVEADGIDKVDEMKKNYKNLKLDCIFNNIEKHLLNTRRISDDKLRQLVVGIDDELYAFTERFHADEIDNLLRESDDVIRNRFEHDLSRFDFRKIEDVVYERKKYVRTELNLAHVFLLFVVETRVRKQFERTDDCLHRSADFMYGVCQKCHALAGIDARLEGFLAD